MKKNLLLNASILAGLALSWATSPASCADASFGKHDGLTLKVLSETDPYFEGIKKTKDGFKAVAGAAVDVDGYGYDALHEKTLLGCSQNDPAYDVMIVDGIWLGELTQAGCLDKIDDRIKKEDPKLIAWDDYTAPGAAQASWQGARYCLPIAIYYELLYYRTDLFKEAGLEPPKTFSDLVKDAAFFTNNPKFPGVYGYAMNNQRGAAAGQQYFEWIFNAKGKPWVSNNVGSKTPYADQTPLYNSTQSVALVEFFKSMLKYGPPGVQSYGWDERANAFASGKLAMINDWSVRAQIAADPTQSRVVGKFASAPMPTELGTSLAPVGGWVMCMNAHGTHKDAAWDFMKWFASPAVHKQYVLAGGTPSRVSVMTDPEVQTKAPWTKTIYEVQKNSWAEIRPRIPEAFQLIDILGVDVNKAIIGSMTPKAALDDANTKIKSLLEDAGELK